MRVILFLSMLFVTNTYASKFYVNDGSTVGDIYTTLAGSNTLTSGASTKPYLTLTYALANSGYATGDTIYIDAGTYNNSNEGGNTIPSTIANVKIIGAGITATVFDGTNYMSSGASSNWFLLKILSDNVAISNLSIKKYFKEGAIDITASASAVDSSRTYITNVFFDNNESDNTFDPTPRGGAVCILSSTKPASVYFNSCNFNQNIAETSTGGGAIYANGSGVQAASVTLEACRFSCNSTTGVDLTTYDGGAILLNNSSINIDNCFFSGNRVNDRKGGAIYGINSLAFALDFIINNSIFTANIGRQGVAVFSDGRYNCTITNSLFYANSTTGGFGAGGTINCNGTTNMNIINCTVANNLVSSGTDGSGLSVESATSYNVFNSIIYGNQTGNVSSATVSATYCDIEPVGDSHSGVTGNISTNPLFTGAPDFTLQGTSLAINAGNLAGAPTSDITGFAHSGNPDMGCFESGSANPTTSTACVLFISCPTVTITSATPTDTICSGSVFATSLTSSPATLVAYAWTSVSVTGITGHSTSGTGNISETLTNTTTGNLSVSYTITPTYNGSCVGAPVTYTVVVSPTPTLNSAGYASSSICSGVAYASSFSSDTPSGITTYSWTSSAVAGITGHSTSGVGDVNETLVNASVTVQAVVYTITPAVGTCVGLSEDDTVYVNPVATITSSTVTTGQCSGATFASAFVASTAAGSTSYAWTSPAVVGITGHSTSGTGDISETLVNTTAGILQVVYTITPSFGSCSGTVVNDTVNVAPVSAITSSNSGATICSGDVFNSGIVTNTASGSTVLNWVSNAVAGINGHSTSGTGDISETLVNTTATVQTVVYTVTPAFVACNASPVDVIVHVNPNATVTSSTAESAQCSGATFTTSFVSNTAAVSTTYAWTSIAVVGVNGHSTNGTGDINETLINTTAGVLQVIYTITPFYLSCAGVTVNDTVDVNSNPTIDLTGIALAQPSCGLADGSITGVIASGTAPLSYSWNGAATQSTADTLNAAAGAYTLVVTDFNSCTATSAVVSLTNPSAPATPIVTAIANLCAGDSITLSVVNPDLTVSYNWTGPVGFTATDTTFTILNSTVANAGNYAVTATAFNCTSAAGVQNVVVNALPLVPVISLSGPATFCAGDSVTLTSSANAGNNWNPTNETTQSIVVNTSGTFTVTVTDVNSCSSTSANMVVVVNTLPTAPIVSLSGPSTFCNGDSVVLISDVVSGLVWTPSNGTNDSLVVFASGSYSVTTTDVNGCSSTSAATNVTVNNLPTAPVITASGPLAFCVGDSVTLVSDVATGIIWAPSNATNDSIIVYASNTYSVTVTDVNGCSSTSANATVTVNSLPAVPTISLAGNGNTFCLGGNVNLTSSAVAGNVWAPGNQTTQSINVNSSGTYHVTVTNASGCSSTSADTIITVNPLPATPVVSLSGPATFCIGDSVILISNVSNGTVWTPTSVTNDSLVVYASGNYSVTVTDVNGCSSTSGNTNVVVNTMPIIPVVTLNGPTTFCSGDTVTLSSSAVTGNVWTPGNQVTQSINATTSGIYSVTVTNAGGCSSTSLPITVTVNQNPTLITSSAVVTDGTCGVSNGSITGINATGGTTPYFYNWYNAQGQLVGTGSTNLSGMPAGVFNLVVSDSNNCIVNSNGFTISNSNALTVDLTESTNFGLIPLPVNFTANTSIAVDNYNWQIGTDAAFDNNVNTTSYNFTATGSYLVTVIVTKNGCTATDTIWVVADVYTPDIIPNVFSPNNDGENDLFITHIHNATNMSYEIYDRWGLLMYTNNGNIFWDGYTTAGLPCSDGTYYYIIKYTDKSSSAIVLKGSLSLFK